MALEVSPQVTPIVNYDPKNIVITVNGETIEGFADSTFVTIERDEDNWTKTVGADGTVARSRTRNVAGRVTLTLMQTSASNAILEGFIEMDDYANLGQFYVSVLDANYKGKIEIPCAWISKPPAVTFGREIEDREWVLDCAQILYLDAFSQEAPEAPAE